MRSPVCRVVNDVYPFTLPVQFLFPCSYRKFQISSGPTEYHTIWMVWLCANSKRELTVCWLDIYNHNICLVWYSVGPGYHSAFWQGLNLWIMNRTERNSEKYGMMGGLGRFSVKASDSSQWYPETELLIGQRCPSSSGNQQLSFWLARAAPEAELLIG